MRPRAADGVHSSLTSDLSVVRKHCRRHTLLGMIDSHMRRAGAEVTLLALTRLPPVASPAWAATMSFPTC